MKYKIMKTLSTIYNELSRVENYDSRVHNLVLPPKYSKIIFYFSLLGIPTTIYGLFTHNITNSLIPLSVTTTSLLFWINPKYNWRRTLDISTCIFCSLYIFFNLLYSELLFHLLIIKFFGATSYGLGCIFHNKGYIFLGTILHIILHLTAHIECYLLYHS